MLTEQQVRDSLDGAIEPGSRFTTPEEMLRTVIRQTIAEPMARAAAELPPSAGKDQLRNYAGRVWEIINTPVFTGIYRIIVADVPEYPALARFFVTEVSRPVHLQLESIIARGIARGEFRPVPPAPAARALLASFITQAFWCNHGDVWGQPAGGIASRVVPETLSLLLDGLNRPQPTDEGSQ